MWSGPQGTYQMVFSCPCLIMCICGLVGRMGQSSQTCLWYNLQFLLKSHYFRYFLYKPNIINYTGPQMVHWGSFIYKDRQLMLSATFSHPIDRPRSQGWPWIQIFLSPPQWLGLHLAATATCTSTRWSSMDRSHRTTTSISYYCQHSSAEPDPWGPNLDKVARCALERVARYRWKGLTSV